jgi:hypothetical protein
MTPIQLRTKWRIALASNFFKPNSLYLRELILGNQFTYSFSPMGVLCQVSQLGDFIEDRVPGWLGEKSTVRSAYAVVNSTGEIGSYLPSGTTDLSRYPHHYSLTAPPRKVIEAAGLGTTRIHYMPLSDFPNAFYFTADEARQTSLANYTTIRFSVRLKNILQMPSIPRAELYPLIANLLEAAEERFQANNA